MGRKDIVFFRVGKLDPTVGGTLQSAGFYSNNFKVSGVVENELNDNKELVKSTQYLRGFELDQKRVPNEYPFLFVSYGYTPVEIPARKEGQEE